MNRYALDSSALLAVVNEETGAATVEKLLDSSVISAVNLSEALAKLVVKGARAEDALMIIGGLVQAVIPFDRDMAIIAARMVPETKKLGLSLGDRAVWRRPSIWDWKR